MVMIPTRTSLASNVRGHCLRQRVIRRFLRYVRRNKPTICWEWTGYRDSYGYGRLNVRLRQGKRPVLAHRVSWVIAHRQRIPRGMCVCHTCDNPPCCNPAHLVLGTKLDNARDRDAKGRGYYPGAPGELNGSAKLTPAMVRRIDWLYRVRGFTLASLARLYRITQTAIWRIVHGKSWRHLRAPDGAMV